MRIKIRRRFITIREIPLKQENHICEVSHIWKKLKIWKIKNSRGINIEIMEENLSDKKWP